MENHLSMISLDLFLCKKTSDQIVYNQEGNYRIPKRYKIPYLKVILLYIASVELRFAQIVFNLCISYQF